MDGSLAIQPQTESTLNQEMRAIAAALVQREAEQRARHKAWRQTLPRASAEQVRRAHLQNAFLAWARGTLEVKVRQTDIALRPTRYTLTQTVGPTQALNDSAAPDTVIAHTTLTLARDYWRDELTIALHADGVVRARRKEEAGRPAAGAYGEADVSALREAMAERFVTAFVRDALAISSRTRSPGEAQAAHQMFR